MLKRIQCDSLAECCQDIAFNPDLNVILGDSVGSSAIGKTTYLNIIDFVFGGNHYYSGDIQAHVGAHTICFEFVFDGESNYFYRETMRPDYVILCDDKWHFREELELAHYHQFLAEKYACSSSRYKFEEIISHFFRIYGHDNAFERMPFLKSVREGDAKGVDFLMYLFGRSYIIDCLVEKEKILGVQVRQLSKKAKDQDSADQATLHANEESILSLRERYDELMNENEDYQFDSLGFDQQISDKLNRLKQEVLKLSRGRDAYQAQIDAIQGSKSNRLADITGEFSALTQFFPGANIRALQDIEHFHSRIREILAEEAQEQIDTIQKQINRYDAEITKLKIRIKEAGLTRKLATTAISQCVEIKIQIESLLTENEEIVTRINDREAKRKAELELAALIEKQKEAIQYVQCSINDEMMRLFTVITQGREPNAPKLTITDDKKASFETPGNTSEGSAFKGLIIYDLAIMNLCKGKIPALIHDSNILARLEGEYLAPILTLYKECGHQVFIAFDNPSTASPEAKKILDEHIKVRLAAGQELYGHSWSKLDKPTTALRADSITQTEGDESNGDNT